MTPLGIKIEARKDARGLSKVEIAGHWETYEKIVTGRSVDRRTLRRAFTRLGWDPDSLEDALAGEDPRPLAEQGVAPPVPDSDTDGLVVVVERFGEFVDGFVGLTPDERRIVLDYLERGRKRRRARALPDNGV